jgi:uncharacterized cupin superfamily protein
MRTGSLAKQPERRPPPNLFEPRFDEPREHDGFLCSRARLGRQAGAERLGLSLWEIGPGQAAYPYHFHLAEEEMLVVLEGRLSLRGPGGWRDLAAGEVVSFPRGEEGAHQVVNRGETPAKMLAISTSGDPDLVVYPDSSKLGAFERRPDGGGLRAMFRLSDTVDYHEGEKPPAPDN